MESTVLCRLEDRLEAEVACALKPAELALRADCPAEIVPSAFVNVVIAFAAFVGLVTDSPFNNPPPIDAAAATSAGVAPGTEAAVLINAM